MNRFFGVRGAAAISGCLLAMAVSWWMLAGLAQATTVAAPTISGTAQQGQVLTVTNGAVAPVTATPPTDQWENCGAGGVGCTAITGQTGANYTLTAADVGHTIVVAETATDTAAPPSLPATATATSAPTTTVLPLPPANTAAPTISGTAQQGLTLTLHQGTWTNSPTSITDQWEDCTGATCTAIVGQTGANYTPTAADVGRTIQVVETASNGGTPAPAPVSSAPTAAVLPAVPGNIAPPTISGPVQQGQTLSLLQGVWTNSPTSITDQWEACTGLNCAVIPGQTGATYTLTASDVGHTIEVVENAANSGGPGPAAAAGPTGVVTATSITSVVAFPATAPTTNQTVTLLATVSSASGNGDLSGSVSFFNGTTRISGCSGKGVKGGQIATVICQASFPAGTALVSAAYVPGAGSIVVGSSSAPTAVVIGRDPTSISLTVAKQVPSGTRATYNATLVPPSGNSGPVQPTGSIEFFDHGQPILACVSQPLSNLAATCTVQYKSKGAHDISATYSGDSNFTSSASSTQSVQVVKASKGKAVLRFVSSTLQWTFFYHPTYTQLILLKAFRIVRGTSVLLRCQGGGCPFDNLHVARSHGASLNLVRHFRRHHLRAGTQITIRLTHRHWVGRYYSFTMRAGRPPVIHLSCLAAGRAIPGVGC